MFLVKAKLRCRDDVCVVVNFLIVKFNGISMKNAEDFILKMFNDNTIHAMTIQHWRNL